MRILFVWPNKDQYGFKPMGISLLSALLKAKGHEVDLFDTTYIDFGYSDHTEALRKIKIFKDVDYSGHDISKRKADLAQEVIKKLDDFKPDIVGVSALSDEKYIGLQITKIVKEWNPNVVTVWGGKAATMSAHIVLNKPGVDYVCIDEGMEFMPQFVECIAAGGDPFKINNIAMLGADGEVKRGHLSGYFQSLDSLPYLDWSIFDDRHFLKPYDGQLLRGGDHMISWGCPYICTYCSNHAFKKIHGPGSGKFLRMYGVDRIVAELQFLVEKWNLNFFKFHDEEFALKPIDYLKELAQKYKTEIGVPFSIMANARNVTAEKVELLSEMGCVSVSMGIETGNAELRNTMLKRLDSEEQIINANKLLNQAGIRTTSFNMFGIPFETRETVMETIELNRKAEVRYPNATFFYPFRGLKLREIAIENGLWDEKSEKVYEQDKPALNLTGISEEELIALYERFTLYVKMPKKYYQYIERSEQNDEIGHLLTIALYKIYEECVFANNGVWQDDGKNGDHIAALEGIINSAPTPVHH